MKWINIDRDLPEDGAIVYVKITGKPEILCNYKNDSFGLGDYDFKIVKWRYAILLPSKPDQESLYYKPRSTQYIEGHTFAYS